MEAAGAEAYNYPGAAEEKSLIEQMKVRWGETLEDSDDDESDDDADMEGDEGAENEVHPLHHLDAQLPFSFDHLFWILPGRRRRNANPNDRRRNTIRFVSYFWNGNT